ncbi:putative tRNA pseudouridine synthase 1 [Porphyridium purpureum]|uniref:tRNA pseudouridine(55) synthase n=1 Tax=Porphyridium purpureum TaxID=35688 RepID=A0A5J4YLY0_PORPP|nr:putative tRNA pseudouridine synthase 1 [Porphyridium purpureum]|eukprot:POR9720..scf244_11
MSDGEAVDADLSQIPDCHFLILDKPYGETSAAVVETAKRCLGNLYKASLQTRYDEYQTTHASIGQKGGKRLKYLKVGHGGTLDPFATGVLVLGIEGGTKLLDRFLSGSKAYECTAHFGVATNTQDVTGDNIENRPYSHVTKQALDAMIHARFLGEIMQIPPMYSALKVNGKRLYEYARANLSVKVDPRPIQILALEVLEVDLPRVKFRVECGGGTYVRTLIHDLAHAVDSCAHLTQLRRTRCGMFSLENAISADRDYLRSLGPELARHLTHADAIIAGRSGPTDATQ